VACLGGQDGVRSVQFDADKIVTAANDKVPRDPFPSP
jgi:hypothetical protein